MSKKTTHLELIKPELTDTADITATNENWDKLDENLYDLQTQIMARDPICFVDTTSAACTCHFKPGFNLEFRSLKPDGLTSLILSLYPGSEFSNNIVFHHSKQLLHWHLHHGIEDTLFHLQKTLVF